MTSREEIFSDVPRASALQPTRPRPLRNWIARYALAVISVAAAIAITISLLDSIFIRNQFALFYAAVMITAFYGGLGPGLVATALSVYALDEFFMPSFMSWDLDADDIVQIALFALVAVLISYLNTTNRRAMAEMQKAKEDAESANRSKDQFLAVLSHELRTPLTPVLAASSMLETNNSLDPDLLDTLRLIHRNVALEARLIDDLLDLTRISKGKLELHFQLADTHELLDLALESCRGEISNKQLQVETSFDATRHHVRADPVRLQQVFWNLINNAAKFTQRGGEIRIATSSDADGRLQVEIADTGIGIAPDILPRIFDAFEQGDASVTRQFGGLGLGLAITKTLVQAQGGTIAAHSEGVGRGAKFIIQMRTATRSSANLPTRPSAAEAHAGRLKILLVEDHADTAYIMTRLLKSFRHEVRTADSVQSALGAARDDHFDLIISDLGLPDGSGLELTRQIRALRSPPMRGIAISGFGMEEDIRRSHEAGFGAHLTKPVTTEQLQIALDNVVAASAS
jgi:signal transduction histidine kinase/CheY-like chemotaxis protein